MADKEKRLRKALLNLNLKGKLKMVKTLEEAHFVLINKIGHGTFRLTRKDMYIKILKDGYTFPEEEVYYLVSTNPRDVRSIERKYLSNAVADMKTRPK